VASVQVYVELIIEMMRILKGGHVRVDYSWLYDKISNSWLVPVGYI
jgi:hypothetical protein